MLQLLFSSCTLITVISEHMFIKVKTFKQYVFVPGIIAKSEPLKNLTVSVYGDKKANPKLHRISFIDE